MKMRSTLLLLCLITIGTSRLSAQSWNLFGNNLAATTSIGSNNNFGVNFKTNNIFHGTLTSTGLWGFGTTAPNSKVHINGAPAENPLRVEVDGASKLFVHRNGGVSIASPLTPPPNGLFVFGNLGVGTSVPVAKFQVISGTDVSPAGGGFIVSGSTTGLNIGIDDNEIMARSNGVAATLSINNEGGNIVFNGANAGGGSNIGINTAAPVSDLHILHTNGFISNGVTLKNSFAAGLSWNIYSATTDELWFSNDGIRRGTIDGTSGAYTASSDRRLKKDIVPLENVLEKVLKLNPSIYNFNSQDQSGARKYIGLIAQEVQPLFPEAVYEHEGRDDGMENYLSMDYSTFGVIAIRAIQEQQQRIEQQEEKIVSLESRIDKLEAALIAVTGANNTATFSGVILEQNAPNPFRQTTTFRYKIPGGSQAQLKIYDVSGKLIKSMNAPASGQAQISANELKAGTYIYTLLVNGKAAASKKMVLLK